MAAEWALHYPRLPWAAPLGPETLCVRATTSRGAFRQGWATYRDRYAGHTEEVPLRLIGREADREHWEAHLHLPTRRFAYHFRWEDKAGRTYTLTPEGWAATSGGTTYFDYPYIADADLPAAPAWAAGAVLYQIFPERFDNGDPGSDPPGVRPWGESPTLHTFFGGDFAGVRRRLPYLADLGVQGIYLNPIFAAPSTHRYDTADYFSVDPALGTEAELRALVEEAHALGLKVILDGVFNHSGADFAPFRDARERGPDSPFWDWFRIAGSHITTEPPTYETFACNIASMPKLMTHRPAVRDYLLRVATYWTEGVGIDGWRLDVANEVDHAFWRAFRAAVHAVRPDALLIGEIWHDPVEFLDGSQFDGATDYRWRGAVLDLAAGRTGVTAFASAMARLHAETPPLAEPWMMRLIGSHDVERVRSHLGGDRRRALLAAGLQLTWPGMPSIYYGDEIGMEGGGDIDARRCMEWSPDADGWAMHARYRQLCRLRRDHPALRRGGLREVHCDGRAQRYAYLRINGSGEVLVAVNAGEQEWEVRVPGGARRLDGEAAAAGESARLGPGMAEGARAGAGARLGPLEVGLWAVPPGAAVRGRAGARLDWPEA